MKLILPVFIILSFFSNVFSDVSLFELIKPNEPGMKSKTSLNDPYNAFNLSEEEVNWVENTLDHMTVYEKCAQMIMPWVEAGFMNHEDPKYRRIIHLVKDLKVGGLIFFEGDIFNQVLLTNEMQRQADIPLLIASDFERGVGMRLRDGIEFPYNMAIAAADDTSLTYQMGKVVALEARSMGVQQNFAPMGDINVNSNNPIINIRSYSEDKDIISKHMLAFIKGSHEENVLTTAKHFPGHGATNLDSHKDLPLISSAKEEFEANELVPFKEAIAAGVKSVMIGHLEVPAFEPSRGLPATLSKNIITGLLKNKLGFTGLVVTDAMNMHGMSKKFKPAEATIRAVEAGNDIILFPPDEDISVNALYHAVESGVISQERINYSVRKILAAKKWLQIDKNKFISFDDVSKTVNKKSHLRLAQEIADKSITLLKNEDKLVPLDPSDYKKPVSICLSDLNFPKDYYFPKLAKEKFENLNQFCLGKRSTPRDYKAALRLAAKSDLVIVPIYVKVRAFQGSVNLEEKQTAFIKQLSALNKPVVFLSMGNPYILSEFPHVGTYLCSYGEPKVSQIAMMKALTGEIPISGILPISIPNTPFKIGSGIKLQRNDLQQNTIAGEDSMYNFDAVNSLMQSALSDSVFPGAVLYVGHKGHLIYKKAFGKFTYDPDAQIMNTDAMFDLASVSKVIGTTTAAMILFDEGKLILDKKVSDYLPEFGNHGKEKITIRNLLLHNSGLIAFKPFYKMYKTPKEVISDIMNTELDYPTGSKFVYSDLGMITLQQVIERISGMPLDQYLKKHVFDPLGMNHTMYNPPENLYKNCAPTETDKYWRMTTLRGKVHDEAAYLLGGVAGHAGLFSTAGDLSVFLQMMLNRGRYNQIQLIKPETVDLWTTKQTNQSSRGLGWDTKASNGSSAGSLFSSTSFGHTGFTGTSVWVDKKRDLFVILLTNRVYPSRENGKIIHFRPKLHDAVVKSISYL
ncbi:MAG: glycoside hydrolase family 3 N-terminal domain-containing protein [Bacillota bacterium]